MQISCHKHQHTCRLTLHHVYRLDVQSQCHSRSHTLDLAKDAAHLSASSRPPSKVNLWCRLLVDHLKHLKQLKHLGPSTRNNDVDYCRLETPPVYNVLYRCGPRVHLCTLEGPPHLQSSQFCQFSILSRRTRHVAWYLVGLSGCCSQQWSMRVGQHRRHSLPLTRRHLLPEAQLPGSARAPR